MTESLSPPPSPAGPSEEGTLSPFQRAVAVFVRPANAWSGLETKSQWWFPFVIVMLCTGLFAGVLYSRAVLPMVLSSMETQVADGQMQPEQMQAAERMMTSPIGMGFSLVSQVITQAVVLLFTAAAVMFGVGFLLGKRMGYRLSLEVACWAWLVKIPEYLVVGILAWFKQSLLGVHAGFGALLPEPETPSRLVTGVGHFLDALGPLALWPLAVGILGAAALSGAPRRSTAWVFATLYVVLSVLGAALATLSSPTA